MSERQSTMREESFDSIHSSEFSNDTPGDDSTTADEMDVENTKPKFLTVRDVHRAIHPLQATADRVGRQVEQFAETLDKLGLWTQPNSNDCRRVIPLVYDYEKIAADTVKSLKKHHGPERQEMLKGSWNRRLRRASRTPPPQGRAARGREGPGFTTPDDLQSWEQERQTWQLLRLLLQTQYPAGSSSNELPNQEEKFLRRPSGGQPINRYSSEHDVWETFLSDFDAVWEKHVVVEWLKANADSTDQDVASVIAELEEGADRGSGLSAHGWLYSKEAIKAQKRLRSWPQPLEPGSPGIDISLMTRNQKEKLITQLDPDAFSRQGRNLESEDVFFERATWLGCWEMIRRGKGWESIRDFCQERIEVWRALSIRGDPRLEGVQSREAVMGAQSRSLWRKMCLNAAKGGGIDDYENAVYGLLSGDLASTQKVVRSWDDYLFVLYNSQLLNQFDFYIQRRLACRLPRTVDSQTQRMFFDDTRPSNLSGQEAWNSLLTYEVTKEEAQQPIKMLQGSLIAGSFQQHIRDLGLALGRGQTQGDLSDDHDMLRVLTHIILVFNDLRVIGNGDTATENIIFAYVNFLGQAGKQDLLPLYCSRLSEKGGIECLARQLPAIVEAGERRRIMNLMNDYELDIVQILRHQLLFVAPEPDSNEERQDFPSLDMLEYPRHGNFGFPTIKIGFMGEGYTDEQLDLIHAVEWYLLLELHWNETMWAVALAYKFFFRTGAFAAASELSRRISFSFVSLEKTRHMFGRSMDVAAEKLDEDVPSRERYNEVLLTSSDTFRGLEAMVIALDALEEWKEVAGRLDNQPDPRHARNYKTELQEAHDAVVSSVEPLLRDDWLQKPMDDKERADLEAIRTTYLPDIILGYIDVLQFDGLHLSRDILLKIMNLAVEIASPPSRGSTNSDSSGQGLSEACVAFSKAGRMGQLVETLTSASFAVLRADEATARKGKKGKKVRKSGPGGENLDIWNVRIPDVS